MNVFLWVSILRNRETRLFVWPTSFSMTPSWHTRKMTSSFGGTNGDPRNDSVTRSAQDELVTSFDPANSCMIS